MKNPTKPTVQTISTMMLAVFICLFSTIASAQIIVVQFMKVQPGQLSTYLEVEEAWAKIHQKSVDNGYISAWTLNEKLFHGTDDEYDYATVNVYPDWATYEKGVPDGYYEEFTDSIYNQTGASRKLIRQEVYVNLIAAENPRPAKYTQFAFMKVEQGNAEAYVDMEKKYFKVYHEALIEAGEMNSWGIYSRIVPSGSGNEFNYVAANGYESLTQSWNTSQEAHNAALKKAVSGTTTEEVIKLVNETRTMVTTEIWKNVMSVPASE